MLRLILFLVLALLAFVGALAAMLALTGNLNQESLSRIINREEALPPEPVQQEDSLGVLAAQLKAKEAELAAREEELDEQEKQIETRLQELQALQRQIEETSLQLQGVIDETDEEREQRMTTVATTVSAMKPDKAALALQGLPDDEVADILRKVKDKDRGKIVDAMDAERASRVLQELQQAPI
jgi:flagellar motility protein MotE (MotC chaperone)